MNSLTSIGIQDRFSGFFGKLKEKITEKLKTNPDTDRFDCSSSRNNDSIELKGGSSETLKDEASDTTVKKNEGKILYQQDVPVSLFMDEDEQLFSQSTLTKISQISSVKKNYETTSDNERKTEIIDLKPESVIKNEGQPSVYQYRYFKKDTLCFLGSSGIVPEEPHATQIRELNEWADKKMANYTYREYEKEKKNDSELEQFTKPVVYNRYKDRKNMTVLEFGPIYKTAIPEALVYNNNGNEYIGLEMGKAYIEKQKEFLSADHVLSSHSSEIAGDLRYMPLKPASADLIVASCVPTFYNKVRSMSKVIDIMADTLKPGGEAVIVPWDFKEDMDEKTRKHLFTRFELVETHQAITEYKNGDEVRELHVLRKKA